MQWIKGLCGARNDSLSPPSRKKVLKHSISSHYQDRGLLEVLPGETKALVVQSQIELSNPDAIHNNNCRLFLESLPRERYLELMLLQGSYIEILQKGVANGLISDMEVTTYGLNARFDGMLEQQDVMLHLLNVMNTKVIPFISTQQSEIKCILTENRTMLEDQSKQISELKNQNEDQSKKMDIMLEMMKQQQQRPSLSRSTTPGI